MVGPVLPVAKVRASSPRSGRRAVGVEDRGDLTHDLVGGGVTLNAQNFIVVSHACLSFLML